MRLPSFLTILLLVSATILSSCRQPPSSPAFILITIDTLRADRLSAYGYTASQTPFIDRLAEEGTLFEKAYCDIPWTTGSMSSVMTGLYGPAHGVQFHWQRLSAERQTLAEILQANGFKTAAIIGSFALDAVYGLDQGFDVYDDTLNTPIVIDQTAGALEKVGLDMSQGESAFSDQVLKKLSNDAYRPDMEVTGAAIDWLEKAPEGPFFLWVHYFGPHERLFTDSPSPQGDRVIADYDRDLADTDRAVGTLLDALDRLQLAERTLVVLHSDHGQSLGEHGIIGHGYDLHEATVSIPLIARYPEKIAAGLRVSPAAQNVDILPTALDYLGVEAPAGLSGRSLRSMIEGQETRPAPVFGEVASTPGIRAQIPDQGEFFAPTRWRMAREGNWKYLNTTLHAPCVQGATGYSQDNFFPNPQGAIGGTQLPDEECGQHSVEWLYDVATDSPANLASETENFAASQPEITARLREFTERVAAHSTPGEEFEPSEEQRLKLKSLGYID